MRIADTGLNLDDFEAEARLHIERIEAGFIDASDLADDPQLVNELFRAVHSLKGTAGFFSLQKIVKVTHELEGVFLLIKDGKLAVNEKIADVVLQSVDFLKELTNSTHDDDAIDISEILESLREYSDIIDTGGEVRAARIPFDCRNGNLGRSLKEAASLKQKIYYIKINFNRGFGKYYKRPESLISNISAVSTIKSAIIEGKVVTRDLTPTADSGCYTPDIYVNEIKNAMEEYDTFKLELLVTSVLDIGMLAIATEIDQKSIQIVPMGAILNEKEKDKTTKYLSAENKRETGYSIRLDVSTINDLMDIANEMILTRNQLLSAVTGYGDSIQSLNPILHDINRLTSEIQEKLMLTRMQPISVIFSKFPRIIRDTAKSLNKEIRVESFGDDVMLDKYLLDALTDPVTQLVKNSADHGIELSERRIELNKPRRGTITLNAHMREGLAVIEISDDGAGINLKTLKNRILEKGLVREEKLETMSKEEVFNIVFEPGFSTAKKVTNISGRGVGMDIVKTNIEKLGGTIEIESEIDKGTTIRLKMPLTLSVVRILVITIDSVKYAIPEVHVERLIRIKGNKNDKRIERVNNSLALCFEGRVIPIVMMRGVTARIKNSAPPDIEPIIKRADAGDIIRFLVLKSAGKTFALVIDSADEMVETLIKPLPVYLKDCHCYSNVTVLGDGNAITILDVEGISRIMNIETEERNPLEEADNISEEDKKEVFVFKYSGDEYFALEAKDITRIETIDSGHIQSIGNKSFVNVAGRSVRIITPEYLAPVMNYGGDHTRKKLYLLMLKDSASLTGVLADSVLDKIEGTFILDDSHIHGDCISGTSVLNEKVLVFLNPVEILTKSREEEYPTKTKADEELAKIIGAEDMTKSREEEYPTKTKNEEELAKIIGAEGSTKTKADEDLAKSRDAEILIN